MMRACLIAALTAGLTVPSQLSEGDLARADSAVREAFAYLYALPRDTAGAPMGAWVVDTNATTLAGDRSGHWKIVIAHLTDTGNALKLSEMIGSGGTSPAQLAEAMAQMQKLEGRISRSEAEAAIEINITLNADEMVIAGVSDFADRTSPAISGAGLVMRVKGDWMRLDDRELEIDLERWSPATLLVGFGGFAPVITQRLKPAESLSTFAAAARPQGARGNIRTVAVTAQGNEQMLDRVVKETKWAALAALLN
jgi:hypothetical protein